MMNRPAQPDDAFYRDLARARRRMFLIALPIAAGLVLWKHGGWNDPQTQIFEFVILLLMFMFMSLPLMWIRGMLKQRRSPAKQGTSKRPSEH